MAQTLEPEDEEAPEKKKLSRRAKIYLIVGAAVLVAGIVLLIVLLSLDGSGSSGNSTSGYGSMSHG